MRHLVTKTLFLGLPLAFWPSLARGQGPTLPDPLPASSDRSSSFATSPGSGGLSGQGAGADQELLGGPAGATTPRIPMSSSRPGGPYSAPSNPGLAAPATERAATVPLYGSLALPAGDDVEGPADGL